MMRAGSILIGLTAGLALSASVRADSPATGAGDNPYAPLVARNVFGLSPPPPAEPPAPAEPLPKITPNGIMNLLGTLQALFKVEAAAGQPAKEVKSYMLAVGQREDDIEVLKIDEKAAIVTFNNHGTVQDLPLVAGAASTGTTPGGGPGGPPQPGVVPPPNGMFPPPMGGNRFGNPSFRSRGIAPSAGTGANPVQNNAFNSAYNPSGQSILGAGPAFTGNSTVGNNSQTANTQPQMSAEEQAVNMAAQIEQAKARNDPTLPMLPPPPIPGYMNSK